MTNAADNRPAEIRVLHALDGTPRPLEEIAQRAGLSIQGAQFSLALLEIDGRVESSLAGWRITSRNVGGP
ncbi:hypothetical protein E4U02_15425 [Microbacterium paludicola]|uniref:DprA winged helix domain-containing protein n=1 Tax=Microbacterium paludicola TaxID=300019 RepID=A0A4Y9FKN5_9MICO|nr:hypothetical protein [Microbacterium paludicola]MBF0817792.1 hypothetical protein [Microbacterium paludicola]TFU29785.1 hypothetical protein E4U02_15425 [Microbacterium paludicola]